jgi:hypothetical protein
LKQLMQAIAWVTATAIGLAFGGFALHFPGSFGGLYAWDPVAVAFGAILGFATGLGVGLVQWAALWLPRRQGARLALAMALGIAITHGLLDGAPDAVGFLPVTAASGLAVAAIFAVAFDQRAPAAMLASAVGWAAGQVFAAWLTHSALGMPWHETPVDWSLTHLVAGISIAIAWTVPTAIAGLPQAIRRDRDAPVESMSTATA